MLLKLFFGSLFSKTVIPCVEPIPTIKESEPYVYEVGDVVFIKKDQVDYYHEQWSQIRRLPYWDRIGMILSIECCNGVAGDKWNVYHLQMPEFSVRRYRQCVERELLLVEKSPE